MKRRGFFTKLGLTALFAPVLAKAERRKPDFEHIGGDYMLTPLVDKITVFGHTTDLSPLVPLTRFTITTTTANCDAEMSWHYIE